MPVSSGDVLRVVCKMSWDEDEIQNVYHVRATSGDNVDDADALSDIATALDTAYDLIDQLITDEVSFDSIEVWNLTQEHYVGITDWPGLTAGTSDQTPMPPQTAMLALFGTDTPRSQGRKFLPPSTDYHLDNDGTVTADALTAIEQYIVSLLSGVVGTYIEAEFGNWNDALERFAVWVIGEARDLFATQRRRYFGRGA